ncbi:BTAD domain-containing putative transcriptional regulator [Streptomyces turgidiscabies]|uniref:BTAD domain-containing putative transcriptional regulator n=1 Tax=Streptomyces TaxID=1883 RepID=UPI000662959C|nr:MULTISPECIES: BTAD domain-containing putative transcriptional regulator [Streptomyces]MDX3494090.1 BTAD domain-containing putative transcriptional regulator [Streptomyces turgidiscabies]GAQ68539.1 regulatory protein AfsR [Streptomyces turgidiscabies]
MTVEFDVLGSVEARVDGRIVDLGHARQRCVLAVLLVEANRVVSVDQLLERVWADRPPQRARNTLYGYVSRLRQALAVAEGAEIVRRSGGYVLDVEATSVDLHRLHDLAGRARVAVRNEEDEQAAALFGQALGLWRGDAFAGLDTPWFNVLRDHLDKERTAAERDHTDVRLRCGHHTGLPAELSARVRAHPLDERLAGQFILALYRGGRPADALGHYERTRLLLADELGCDPSLPLQRLHQQILTVDPALNVPAADPEARRAAGSVRALVPRPAPLSLSASTGRDGGAPPGPSASRRLRTGRQLIGRVTELALLDSAIEDALAGAPGVVEVVGEPGIGKTRLLGELGERARRRGFVSLAGRCVEFDRAPYGAFVDALDDHLGNVDFRRLRTDGAPAGAMALLGTVFPAIGERFPAGPEPVTVERYWFHRAVRTLLEAVSADGGLVVSLDDLQWTDEGTAELIDHLVRHPPRTPLLLALAYRPRQAPPRLAAALARAGTEGRLARVELGPLSPAEGAELCGARTDHWRFKRLYEASGGNPFYLEALTRSTAGEGSPAAAADLGPLTGDLPQSVRAALLEELGCLSATARVCTQAAAVLGDSFEADMLAVVARTGEAQTLAALDEIAERDLVRQIGSTRQFRFRHPLVRAAVYQGAGAGWRIEAHTRAAEGLALHGAPLTAQASHVQRSARVGDEHAVDLLVRAARQVMTIAPATAAHWTREALRLLGERSRQRPELWLQQANALGMAGRLLESRDILRTAASLLPARAHDQRARLTALRATMEWALGRYDEATALLLRELADHDGRFGPETADLELGVAVVALRKNDFSTAVHWGERALHSAERIGDPLQTTSVRALLALALTSAGDARSTGYLDLVVEAFDDADDEQLAGRLDIIVMTGWAELLHERYDTALRHLARGLELSRRTGQSLVLADLFAASAYALMWLGRLDEAATYADDALEAASLVGSSEPRSLAEVVSAAVLMWRGDFAGALKICEESLALVGPAPGARRSAIVGMLGHTLLLNGDPAGCVSKVLEAGGGPHLLGFEAPVRPTWFQLLTVANLALGDVTAAESWADRAAAAATPDGPPGRRGFALLARAEVQLARQDPAAGPTACRAAAEFRTARMPLNEAMARLAAGTALAASGRQAEAVAQVEQAKALSVTCGALALCELADQEHRRIAGPPLPPATDS